jgi:hypothetical protein
MPSVLNRGNLRSFVRSGAVVVALLLSISHSTLAAFLDTGVGARPVGMGGAFTAIADDSNAPMYNPAGIVQVQWNELAAAYANLFSGLSIYAGDDSTEFNQSYFAYTSRPLPHIGSLGVSWKSFNATHLYREDTIALTYARNIGDFIPAFDNALAVGINLKHLRRSVSLDSFSSNDPVFAGGDSASAQTLDLGALYKPQSGPLEGFRVALVGMNLTRPDVGFQATDKLPLEGRLGLAYQSRHLPWLVPSVDVSRRNGVTGVAGGAESWLFRNTLGLRGGANKDEAAAGLSYFQMLGKRYGLRLDYGFTIPFHIEDSGGSHRVALTFYF